jgi:hypothetical protein
LALDDDERHALVCHLDGVGVAQLVRCETPASACGRRRAAQLGTRGGGRPWSSAGRAVDDAEKRADRHIAAHLVRFARSLVDGHGPSPRALVAASADFGKASAASSTSTATCSSTPT